jgi:hypothetical protein
MYESLKWVKFFFNKIKNKRYHIVGIVPKSHRKIIKEATVTCPTCIEYVRTITGVL